MYIYICIYLHLYTYMYLLLIFADIYVYILLIYILMYAYIYTYTYIYIYMCVCLYILIYCAVALPWNLTICNDSLYNRILAILLPWNFVWILLEFRWHFVGISWQNVLPHDFALFFSFEFRQDFVGIAQRNFHEIRTVFFVAKCCGKTFCHTPEIKNTPAF